MKNGKRIRALTTVFLAALVLFSACSMPGAQKEKTKKEQTSDLAASENVQVSFDKFLDEVFAEELSCDVLSLHYVVANPEEYGIKDCEYGLGDYSEESFKKSIQEAEATLGRLRTFDYDSLGDAQQMTYELLEEELEETVASSDFYLYGEALKPTSGIQSQLPVLLAEYTFRTQKDVEDYLKLISTVQTFFESMTDYEKERAAAGFFMSDTNLDTILEQCRSFSQNREEHLLLVTFKERLEQVEASEEKKTAWEKENEDLVFHTVIPAYEKLAEELEKLRGSAKTDGGLCNLENGKEYYAYLVRCNTGSDRTIEEMKELISRYEEKDMDEMVSVLSEDLSLYDEMSKTDVPQKEAGEILEDLKEKIQKDFPAAAAVNYQVKDVDKSLESLSSPAFYLTPPLDDIENNVIYINRSNGYEGLELYVTMAHEGYPGHLYQETYFKNKQSHPIRSILGSGGYAEGWGLYAEACGYGMADIKEGVAELNRCNFTTSMAMYANLDIGIHYDGWGLAEAKAYLKDFGVKDEEAVERAYNYIVAEPGNYLKYYMGYLEIQELKEYTKNQLGEDYTDLEFHTFFLDQGSSTFSVLRKRFEERYGS